VPGGLFVRLLNRVIWALINPVRVGGRDRSRERPGTPTQGRHVGPSDPSPVAAVHVTCGRSPAPRRSDGSACEPRAPLLLSKRRSIVRLPDPPVHDPARPLQHGPSRESSCGPRRSGFEIAFAKRSSLLQRVEKSGHRYHLPRSRSTRAVHRVLGSFFQLQENGVSPRSSRASTRIVGSSSTVGESRCPSSRANPGQARPRTWLLPRLEAAGSFATKRGAASSSVVVARG